MIQCSRGSRQPRVLVGTADYLVHCTSLVLSVSLLSTTMSGVWDGWASTLSYYTGYDFTLPPSQPRPAQSHSSLSSSRLPGTADYSGQAADPSTLDSDDDNVTALYSTSAADDEYFNLGGSSFPLLPHAPYMVDPFSEGHVDEAEERAAEVSRAAHHFSSVTNNPSSTLFDFDEDDMLPFAPSYIAALTDYAIDTNELRRYVSSVGDAETWVENHPQAALPSPLPPRRVSSSASSASTSLTASPFAATSLPSAFTFTRMRTASSSSSASTTAFSSRGRPHRRTQSFLTPEQEAERRRSEEEQLAQRELADCLNTVPPHFFAANYDLFQQPLFIEHLASISFPASSAAAIRQHTANSLQLQSSLSSQLDQVEVNLFRQINRRSPLLFSALETMQSLHSDISHCVDAISETHESLSYVESNLVSAGLRLLDNQRRQRNVATLCQRVEMMQTCLRTQQTVQLLLSTGDYSSSLLLIQQTRSVLNNELQGVAAMRNVERKLMEQVRMIEKLMEQDVMEVLTDTSEPQEEKEDERARERRRDGGQGREAAVIRRELTEDERERLTPVLENLIKLGTMSLVITSYRRELTACIKQRLTDLVYHHIDTVVNDELDDTQVTTATVVSVASPAPSSASPTSTLASSPPPMLASPLDDGTVQTSLHPTNTSVSSQFGNGTAHHSPSPAPESTQPAALASPGSAAATVTILRPSSPSGHSTSNSISAQPVSVAPPSSFTSQSSSVVVKGATAAVVDEASATSVRRPAAVAVAASSLSSNVATTASTATATVAVAPASSTITTKLQALTHRQFIDFLTPLFSSLMDPIYRAAAVRDLLAVLINALDRELDVNASLVSDTADAARLLATVANKKHEYRTHLSTMNELLSSSSEFLHLRISKLLSTRTALHSHLPLREFRELLDVVLSFLALSETLCHKPFYGLRGALLGQAKGFVAVFHASCMKEMAGVLEKEKWARVDVDHSYQDIIDNQFVIKRRDRDRDRDRERDKVEEERKTGSRQGGDEEKEERNGSVSSAHKGERKVLFVPIPKSSPSATPASSSPSSFSFPTPAPSLSSSSNFLKFPVVRSLLTLLTLIADYIDLSTHLPALTLDTLQRLLDLLTLFNSRTCQLVLGAGAMHLAGLTSITATHLALSSQCIALLSTQLPVLKRLFEARLTAKQHVFLAGFDRVRSDCNEHVEQIREKLVNIMRDLVEQLMRKMSQWIVQQCRDGAAAAGSSGGVRADGEDDVVSPAVRLLMKQTCSLHRALSDLLSARERSLIFAEIGGSLVGGFMVASRKVEAETAAIESAAASSGGGVKAQGCDERARMLLQANGLHVLVRMRTLQGVEEDVVLRLKEFVEQLVATQKH